MEPRRERDRRKIDRTRCPRQAGLIARRVRQAEVRLLWVADWRQPPAVSGQI